jgi:hypothetical protein
MSEEAGGRKSLATYHDVRMRWIGASASFTALGKMRTGLLGRCLRGRGRRRGLDGAERGNDDRRDGQISRACFIGRARDTGS